jgi:ubiquinone biosynthesis monooxygenase Coq7
MMRVDHSGEVCAQALYLAQAMFARSSEVRKMMLQSAAEEGEHLDLTLKRLGEIGARPSHLNPFWFAGSFALGSIAAMAGDRASLGFLAETERQVAEHLEGHLRRMSSGDQLSRRVLRRMRDDETGHAAAAESDGGREFPLPLRAAMRMSAKLMTTFAAKI